MSNQNIYIHEFVDVIGHNRANYMHHMTANFSPRARRDRGQRCYGVWGTVGSTGRWPEVVNIWEESGWAGLAASFRFELNHPTLQDPALSEWWARAAQFRRGGIDRILVPGEWTSPIEELCAAGVTGECFAHETVTLRAGGAWDYVDDLVQHQQVPVYSEFGWKLAGAFVTALRDESEAIVLWAVPTWDQWAELEAAGRTHHRLRAWNDAQRSVARGFERFLMVDAPLSPFRTGRQPEDSDRASYLLPELPGS